MQKWKTLAPGQLDKLVASGKPVYVLNTSRLPSGDKGTILVNFYDGTRREFFKMPPTFIPVAASDVIPPKKLTESKDFKQCLIKGMLTLVDPDQAEDYLSTSEAQEEYENLMLSEHSARTRNIDVEAEVTKRARVSHQTGEASGPVHDAGTGDMVSNRVRGWIESMTSQELSAKDVLTNLKRHQSALGAGDLSYVIANAGNVDLSQWASKALSELVGSGVAPKSAAKAAPAKKAVVASKKKDESAFDFGTDSQMSAAELAADASAKARYASQQALGGESQVEQEINQLLTGKK